MGTTRVLGPLLYRRFQLADVLLFASAFCIFCYALTVFSTSPGLSLAGCAMTGAAVALMWPATISLAAGRIPNGGTRMFALLAAFGDIGCSLGPWLTGLVSDLVQANGPAMARAAAAGLTAEQAGLKSGLAAAGIFPVLMIVCLLLRGKNGREAPVTPIRIYTKRRRPPYACWRTAAFFCQSFLIALKTGAKSCIMMAK